MLRPATWLAAALLGIVAGCGGDKTTPNDLSGDAAPADLAVADASVDAAPDAAVPDLARADRAASDGARNDSGAALAYLTVVPSTASVGVGATTPLAAIATYTDGSTANATALSTWVSAQTMVAKVGDTAGSKGIVTGVSAGTTTIYASYAGLGAAATVTVTQPAVTVTSIAVTPATASIPTGSTQAFTATATYSNATMGNVTTLATWYSDAIAVATVSNAAGSEGVATGQAAGTAHIIAAFGGRSGQGTLTVTASTTSPVGKTPCTAATQETDCPGPAGYRVCLTNWGGGYCSVDCSPSDGGTNFLCPTGSTCYRVSPSGSPNWYCLRDCGTTADCPAIAGVMCYPDTTTGKGACFSLN